LETAVKSAKLRLYYFAALDLCPALLELTRANIPSQWMLVCRLGTRFLLSCEFLRKGVSQGAIRKAPANSTTLAMPTLRRYSMAGMKIIHCCQSPPKASRRHGYIYAVRKVFLNFLCGHASSVIHKFF
jgi:hypothetical protein